MSARKTGAAALTLLIAILLGACSQPQENAVTSEQLQALVTRVQTLEDSNAIQKLQANYVHSLFTQRYESIPALYAQNNPDVSVEFSDSGMFKGIESVTRLYTAFAKTREIPGFFILHMAVDPYI